jgi:TOTE conflict system, Archaeo-Eukaryotic Primase domain
VGLVESFVRLFRGRSDAYGTWKGGCKHEQLSPEHFVRHLHSYDPRDWIGVYNVIGDRCSWGCVDIDTPSFGLAAEIRATLGDFEIPAWIEQTDRGVHIWVFPASFLVDASTMQRALLAACLLTGYQPKEIFPKQVKLGPGMLGNYVRLPLNGVRANPPSKGARRFVHGNVTVEDMDRNRAPSTQLELLAERIPRCPQPVDRPVDYSAGVEFESTLREVGGLAYRLWRDGPSYDHDRSNTLVRLAHLLHQAGVSADVTYAAVCSADDRWGKGFLDRGEPGVQIVQRIVDKAYAS